MQRRRRPANELRTAIECLPLETQEAMLEALDSDDIIVGAYTDRDGGVCPMLAAHRHGGRTSYASFAHAWDRYTRAGGGPRKATERELRTLRTMLEASLATGARGSDELAAAIAEHQQLKQRRRLGLRDTGERERSRELGRRPGWAWLRIFRRYDTYRAALEDVRARERATANGHANGHAANGHDGHANGHSGGAESADHERERL